MAHIPRIPPLIGDAKGHYRIKISGNSGSGKSTLGAKLATMLNLPYISLDELYWKPGWVESTPDEMRASISQALDAAPNGWVVDGNYKSKGGNIAWERATDVIWLDPPLMLYFPRVVKRSMLRLLGIRPPHSPGCQETWTYVFFSRDSVLLWCLRNHKNCRRWNFEFYERLRVRVENGEVRGVMRRFGGQGKELERWLEELETWLETRQLVFSPTDVI